MLLNYVVTDNKYINIKELLKQEYLMSDRLILKLKTNNRISSNGISSSVSKILSVGDNIEINLNFEEDNSNILPIKMNLDIIFEDDALLVINKPANTPVHPSMLHYSDSLSNGVKYYFDSIGLKRKLRPVNRLDRNTTGIVIFAKNDYIQECLSKQMHSNKFKKEYIAIVDGTLDKKYGTINAPIGRKEGSIIERQVLNGGDNAVTEYNVITQFEEYCLIHIVLKTGRTHQIRVHMAHIGHPILGDSLYGKESIFISRQALHAEKVTFIHPITKKEIELHAPIPSDIEFLKNENR